MLTLNDNYQILDVSSKFTKFAACSLESRESELYKQFVLHFLEFNSFFSVKFWFQRCKTKEILSGKHMDRVDKFLKLTNNHLKNIPGHKTLFQSLDSGIDQFIVNPFCCFLNLIYFEGEFIF